MVASLLLAVAAGAVSSSDLGVYVLADDQTAETILGPCPRVATWASTDLSAPGEIERFRQRCPDSAVVLQLAPAGPYTIGIDVPATAAINYWNSESLAPAYPAFGQVTWIEPTELSTNPPWYAQSMDPAAAQFAATFWSKLFELAKTGGFHLLVGAIRPELVGTVPANGGSTDAFCLTASAMNAQFPGTWAWSAHAFAASPSQDVATQVAGGALSYRNIVSACGISAIPVFLTEGGLSSGWTDPATDLCWLVWLDVQLKQDTEVHGLALFAAGTSGAASLAPIAGGLASYLAGTPPSCSGTSGGTDGGTGTQGGQTNPGGAVGGGTLTHSSSTGCSTGGSAAAVAILPLVVRRRFRSRQGLNR